MKILLIQLKRIGDLVLTTPAIAAVREKFPGARISLVIDQGTRELLHAIRSVDETFVVRKNLRDVATSLGIARVGYDCCIDFTRNDRSAFLTLISRAKERVTADHPRFRAQLRSRVYNHLVGCDVGALHTVDYHLCLLQPLGIENASPALQLHLPQTAIDRAGEILRTHNISGNFVLLHPGSARAEKFWQPERWIEVIRLARARGLTSVISGGKAAIEQTHIAQIRASANESLIDLSGRIDLLTLTALIGRAQLLVTVDSAPMHLAAAMETPQVVLFGPTNPLHWYPRSAPAIILQGHQSEPISDFRQDQEAIAMNRISTQQVIDAMEALLAAPRAAIV